MFPLSYKGVGPEPTAPYTLPIDYLCRAYHPQQASCFTTLTHLIRSTTR